MSVKKSGSRVSGKRVASTALGRMPITLLIIFLEIVWMTAMFVWLRDYNATINTVLTVLSLLVTCYLILKDEHPSYKMTWIIVIGILPLMGALMYLMFGNKRPSRRMRRKLERVDAMHRERMQHQTPGVLEGCDPRMAGTSAYLTRQGPFPAYANTDVEYFEEGEQLFARLLPDLESAKSYIFMEYFILADGTIWEELSEILCRKAAEGVDVRLIYDDMGSVSVLPRGMAQRMHRAGIKVLPFNPFLPFVSLVMNHRDHRKITVIDGRVAYTGGINIADEYANRYERYGHWKDTGLRMEGGAVDSFTVMFLNMWNAFRKTETDYTPFLPTHEQDGIDFHKGVIQPYCDSPLDEENLAENVYLDILAQAKRYVYIFTPYLVIDSDMMSALTLAAKRGVDVRIVTPGVPDKKIVYRLTRSHYRPLLQAGVRIYEYSPGFLHAKSYVCDDRVAVVGTINMDYRSLFLHFECGALLLDSPVIADIKQDAISTMAESREVTLKDCKKYSVPSLIDLVLRVFSPLL